MLNRVLLWCSKFKLLLVMLASCIRTAVGVLTALLPTLLLPAVIRKAVEYSPPTWAPAPTHETLMKFFVAGFQGIQPCSLWPFMGVEERISRQKIFLSLSLSSIIHKINVSKEIKPTHMIASYVLESNIVHNYGHSSI